MEQDTNNAEYPRDTAQFQPTSSSQEILSVFQSKTACILYPQQTSCHSHVMTALFLTANSETVIQQVRRFPDPVKDKCWTNLHHTVSFQSQTVARARTVQIKKRMGVYSKVYRNNKYNFKLFYIKSFCIMDKYKKCLHCTVILPFIH